MTRKAMHRCQHLIIGSLVSLVVCTVISVSVHAEEPPDFTLTWGSSGTGDGQFEGARGLVTDAEGNVLVADYTNNRIQKFSPTGGLLQKFIPG